ncbi:hypothetical protein RSSE_c3456 [Ralstonia solanacearum]|nr:hypothetical protein RSSE_c3456 [Ralstonia solanacearum]
MPPGEYQRFMEELTALILGLPIYVLACVVDRPGYNKRYLQAYADFGEGDQSFR